MISQTITTGMRRPWGAALLAAAVAAALFMIPGTAAFLQYDRSLIANGEMWRLLTSHWAHWNYDHLFWDVTAFFLLSAFAFSISRLRTAALILLSSSLIPLAVWIWLPNMNYYRGLSGIDSALYLFVACCWMKQAKRSGDAFRFILLLTLIAGFSAKVIFEIATGKTLFVQSMGKGVIAVTLAHIAGAAAGVLMSLTVKRSPEESGQLNQ